MFILGNLLYIEFYKSIYTQRERTGRNRETVAETAFLRRGEKRENIRIAQKERKIKYKKENKRVQTESEVQLSRSGFRKRSAQRMLIRFKRMSLKKHAVSIQTIDADFPC